MALNSHVAMWTLLAVGLFNSIMFPSIFTLGEAEFGSLFGTGSGLLNMAIVGGAIISVIQAPDPVRHRTPCRTSSRICLAGSLLAVQPLLCAQGCEAE